MCDLDGNIQEWNRNPHANGSIAHIEDRYDNKRLSDDSDKCDELLKNEAFMNANLVLDDVTGEAKRKVDRQDNH